MSDSNNDAAALVAPVGRSVNRLEGPARFTVYCDGDCIPVNLGSHNLLEAAREVAQQHVQAAGCRVAIWRELGSLWEVWDQK